MTERILDRVLGATGDLHVKLCLAESYARQSKLDDAIPLFKEVPSDVSLVHTTSLFTFVLMPQIISSGVPDVVKAAASGLATVTEQLGDVKEAARIRSQYRV